MVICPLITGVEHTRYQISRVASVLWARKLPANVDQSVLWMAGTTMYIYNIEDRLGIRPRFVSFATQAQG